MTPEEGKAYLRAHPAEELSLWQHWVLRVCEHMKVEPPTVQEWDELVKSWEHGKAPIDSVLQLQCIRSNNN